jgi:WD40 repeat protein
MSSNGLYLAIGSSDGSVTIVTSDTLTKLQSFQQHDLPVTGLSFAPSSVQTSPKVLAVLASCSADNKLVIMAVKGVFAS